MANVDMARMTNPSLVVSNTTHPASTVLLYAVEDRVPEGWQVDLVNEAGSFDPGTGKVKWGPYFDRVSRTLTYRLIPPDGFLGEAAFGGEGIFNGVGSPILGQHMLSVLPPGGRQLITGLDVEEDRPAVLRALGEPGKSFLVQVCSDLQDGEWNDVGQSEADFLGAFELPLTGEQVEGRNYFRTRSAAP